MHQQAKGEPNQFTNGPVIGANVGTCPPLHKLIYITFLRYLSIYNPTKGQTKISSLQTYPYVHSQHSKIFNTLLYMQYPVKINIACSIP